MPSESWRIPSAKDRKANGEIARVAARLARGDYIGADHDVLRDDALLLDSTRRDLWEALERAVAHSATLEAERNSLRAEVEMLRTEAAGGVHDPHEQLEGLYAEQRDTIVALEAERDELRGKFERLRDYTHRENAKAIDDSLRTAEVLLGADDELTRLRAERDELRGVLATTADRLNVALRESNLPEIMGSPYTSFAVRDGIVAIYDRYAKLRAERDRLREGLARLAVPCKSVEDNEGQSCLDTYGDAERDEWCYACTARAALAGHDFGGAEN